MNFLHEIADSLHISYTQVFITVIGLYPIYAANEPPVSCNSTYRD